MHYACERRSFRQLGACCLDQEAAPLRQSSAHLNCLEFADILVRQTPVLRARQDQVLVFGIRQGRILLSVGKIDMGEHWLLLITTKEDLALPPDVREFLFRPGANREIGPGYCDLPLP
jgi:hypothetical protein